MDGHSIPVALPALGLLLFVLLVVILSSEKPNEEEKCAKCGKTKAQLASQAYWGGDRMNKIPTSWRKKKKVNGQKIWEICPYAGDALCGKCFNQVSKEWAPRNLFGMHPTV